MKVRIELDPSMDEPEILIRAPRLTPELTQLQERILEQKVAPLAFYKDRSEYFLDVASILFLRRTGRRFLGTPRTKPMRSSRSSMSGGAASHRLLSDIQIHHCQRQADLFSGKVFFRNQHGQFLSDP